jgi:hypothetical protein
MDIAALDTMGIEDVDDPIYFAQELKVGDFIMEFMGSSFP